MTSLAVVSTDDLISVVPYLIGFHPSDSVVVVGFADDALAFCARHDLPPPGLGPDLGNHMATVVAREHVRVALVIGYGDRARVTPTVTALSRALREAGVAIRGQLRVCEDRWWSLTCTAPTCCPEEGNPISSTVPADATFAGMVALPSREVLQDKLAPVTGLDRTRMTAATARVQPRLTKLMDGRPPALLKAGRTAVRAAEHRHRDGGRLSDDEVAWLGALIAKEPVMAHAWNRNRGEDWRLALWSDVVRRVDPAYAPGPACLVGFGAWLVGQGALARTAVDRALAEDPDFEVAVLLDEMLAYGISPKLASERLAGVPPEPGREHR